MATRRGLAPLDLRASPAAPVPRPPQPTRAIWMVESAAAWTVGMAMPARAETAAIWPTRLPSSRRERLLALLLLLSVELMGTSLDKEMGTGKKQDALVH